MKSNSLKCRAEGARRDAGSPLESQAQGESLRLSERVTDAQTQFVVDTARYIVASTLCYCLHCLVAYCEGSSVEPESLVLAVHRRIGRSPLTVPHEPAGRLWEAKAGLISTDAQG